jgi:hypothetical protein
MAALGKPAVKTAADPASIRDGLIARGLPEHVADGFVMNFQDESGMNPGINEIAPLVPGSRGGFGLYQLTGPRRVAYERFAAERGLPVDDVDAQLDFLMTELQGPEAAAWSALQGAQDPIEAARIYSERFLRPGIPNMDKRLGYAAEIAGMPMPAMTGAQPGMMSMGQPAAQADPFEGMGLLSQFAASRGIAQKADAAPIANLWNILTQKKDPRLADMAKQRGGFFGLLGA